MPGQSDTDFIDDIAALLIQQVGSAQHTILFVAEIEVNMTSTAIFVERAKHIDYLDGDTAFSDLLLDYWETLPAGKRWAEMEYVLRGRKFNVDFVYPEEIDPKEDGFDRRDRIVARHFGGKPIVYPPLADDGDSFTL